ncbi:hypothetical protein GCM10023222_14920 [Saccharopolyspora cebuensis]
MHQDRHFFGEQASTAYYRPHPAGPAGPGQVISRIDAPATATVVLGIPKALCSLLIVIPVAYVIAAVMGLALAAAGVRGAALEYVVNLLVVLLVLAWCASGALLGTKVGGNFLARRVLELRPAVGYEQARLQMAWYGLLHGVGEDPAKYSLWVEESTDINAHACSGGIVAVTRAALERVPAGHLQAILAHELAHHVRQHARASALLAYYGFPARILGKITQFFLRLTTAMFFCNPFLGLFMAALWFGCLFPIGLIMTVGTLFMAATAAFDRSTELAADRFAADLGYGPALMQVLQHWINEGHDQAYAAMSWWQRLTASHPPAHERIQHLYTHLQRRSQHW